MNVNLLFINLKRVSFSTAKTGAAFVLCSLVILSACSQAVDEVTITPVVQPVTPPTTNRNFLFNTDLTGTSELIPTSASRVMKDHSLGGNSLRTNSVSVSLSLRMTSGVGLE